MHVIASSNRVNLMHNCVCVYGKEEKESKRERGGVCVWFL